MQPLHNGHIRNIDKALDIADHVLVIAGSANQPRTPKNPFTAEERAEMIKSEFPSDRVCVTGVEDFYADTEWLKHVQSVAHKHISKKGIAVEDASIAILGHNKDHTSSYLVQFPNWKFIEIGHRITRTPTGREIIDESLPRVLDATEIREQYFMSGMSKIGADEMPHPVVAFLSKFMSRPEYEILKEEYNYIARYHDAWSSSPYPVTFVTTDAVVIQSGYVLLVKRRVAPGKGLWALPGGFAGHMEYLEDGVIRELREETRLKVAEKVLRGSIKERDVFDRPDRSLRGRTITHAFLFVLEDQQKLPKVKGSDDAAEARWFSLDVVDDMSDRLFEDHKSIIHTMVGKLKDK